ncbi:MAG: DUF799 domain-containing protein [bacterium]
MKVKHSFYLTGILAALLLSACATVVPYDYTAFNESKPRSILVIPPSNNSVEVEAPYIFLSTISKPLAEKGYYVFPVSVIDQFLQENGMPTPEEMNAVPLDKLREHTGADAVLYVSIEEWGQKYLVLSSSTIVKSHLRLVDARSGALIWDSLAFAEVSSGDGGGGLGGMLVNAIVEQIAGSVHDRTPMLSASANKAAVNQPERGLPQGPYNTLPISEAGAL